MTPPLWPPVESTLEWLEDAELELDRYRHQAARFAEELCLRGHADVVDQILAEDPLA